MQRLNIPTASISDVKTSPSRIFKMAESTDNGVYIFNRGNVAGVMLTQEQYEKLTDCIEVLTDRLVEAEALRRIMLTDVATFSDKEVRGKTAENDPLPIELDDGWD
ncbi:MAG: type II toxin-antitoxin system Phd/YefM family antitoxin [Clostridiales Family XIII bacterium]|jgi:PHD/YefM family antitoxin component YafN of YafNO toxin-antitoxin module|nr:type II toxin-antitoxin system Phd/YefM family antitoxin [Clostridiales Family XIII bacterium]